MPLLTGSSYAAPLWLPGGHAQTIFPYLFRRLPKPAFTRSALATPDGDKILIDRLLAGKKQGRYAVLLSHGLEGDSQRVYMRGMCRMFAALGWDSLARNFRACGGGMNLTPGLYHSGQTEDLHAAVLYALELGYERLLLVGFSIGGNQVLKYLGEAPDRVPAQVLAAAAFSVPCDLAGASVVLERPENALYMHAFLQSLRQKVRLKHRRFPVLYPLEGLDRIRGFTEFDNRYTAPVHGFSSAQDYWEKASCLPHVPRIAIPTLLVNAKNDPFLSESCHPLEAARHSRVFFLERPETGGHVGFTPRLGQKAYWSELRAAEFFTECLAAVS